MPNSIPAAFISNFLGGAPDWYKKTILGFLLFNIAFIYLANLAS